MSFKHNIFVVERFPFCAVVFFYICVSSFFRSQVLLYKFRCKTNQQQQQRQQNNDTSQPAINNPNETEKKSPTKDDTCKWSERRKTTTARRQRFSQFRGDVVENDINCILCVLFCTVFSHFFHRPSTVHLCVIFVNFMSHSS